MAKHYDLGKKGEELALAFLLKKGYEILETNWFFNKAEIDIIAKYKEEVIIVEVKTRSSDYFGNPEDAVDSKKRNLLIMATNEYLENNNLDLEVRFDIITLLKEGAGMKINHIHNAFEAL